MEHRHPSQAVGGQQMNHPHEEPRQDDEHLVHSHGQHAGHSVAMFKNRFWLTLALAVPVVFFSPMFGHLLGYQAPGFPGSAWIPPVLGTVIFFYGGQPFLKGGLNELKSRKPGMMLLIAMAITVAFTASWVTTLGIGGFDLDFWWELALLVDIMLLGHWIEMRALGSAQGALDALAALLPDEAERLTESGTETVRVSELRSGDTILVRSGARMPADGTVIDGQAEFDESMITGESKTVLRSPGDPVVAGTVATDNASASGSPPSATTPPWPASSGWWPRPRPPPRGPRPSPTAPPPSCSTSPPGRASSPSSPGRCWAASPDAVDAP